MGRKRTLRRLGVAIVERETAAVLLVDSRSECAQQSSSLRSLSEVLKIGRDIVSRLKN